MVSASKLASLLKKDADYKNKWTSAVTVHGNANERSFKSAKASDGKQISLVRGRRLTILNETQYNNVFTMKPKIRDTRKLKVLSAPSIDKLGTSEKVIMCYIMCPYIRAVDNPIASTLNFGH